MILTKNSIIQKIVKLLEDVQDDILVSTPPVFSTVSPPPKISKGENYLGLPYVILDYPRIAKDNNLFFIRSMFWWGNFYSSTMQLSGEYQTRFLAQLVDAYEKLKERNYSVGVNEDPWVHHFNVDNYQPISALSQDAFHAVLAERTHIKIAAQWPLDQWEESAKNFKRSGEFVCSLIA